MDWSTAQVACALLGAMCIILVLALFMLPRALHRQIDAIIAQRMTCSLRELFRDYEAWAKVSADGEARLGYMVAQQQDHNFALARLQAYFDKQGIKL